MNEHFFVTAFLLSFVGAPAVYGASDNRSKREGAAPSAIRRFITGEGCGWLMKLIRHKV